MNERLIRVFSRNSSDYRIPDIRRRIGKGTSITGMIVNILLFASKLTVGLLANSIAIVSDSINNLSDAATQFINLFGFVMSGKKADKDHPFGHGRTEYITGLIMSFLIIAIGFEFMKSSIDRILHPADLYVSPVMPFILAGSILVKTWLFFFYRKVGKCIESQSMAAASVDSISDVAITFVTFMSLITYMVFKISIDGYVGIIVSLLVLFAGYTVARDALSPLLGRAPDPAIIEGISDKLRENSGILGVHDVIVHDYGPGRLLASAHVEVDAKGNILEIHDLVDLLEKRILTEMGIPITLHMDPVDHDNPQTLAYRQKISEILTDISELLSLHDFRVVYGKTHTNLIFDISVPSHLSMTDAEITQLIEKGLKETTKDTVFLVIQYDRFYL